MKPKSIFKSRMAVLAILTAAAGALGAWADPVRDWLAGNVPLLMIALGTANFALRRVTHDRVTIFPPEGDEPDFP